MKLRLFTLVFIFAFILGAQPGLMAATAASAPPTLSTLQPGSFQEIDQDLTINVVFVGYEPGAGYQEINETDFLDELPATYRTVNRYPSFYFGNQYLGLNFDYDYNLV